MLWLMVSTFLVFSNGNDSEKDSNELKNSRVLSLHYLKNLEYMAATLREGLLANE